jgi:uncharacterized protein (DUF2252 family)
MSDDAAWARGKAARTRAPRSSHAQWRPPADRADPVQTLARQERDRVPELLPVRHERMLSSPFAFFRGAAAVMAADLASTPSSGLPAQLCGDAHLANFGAFAAPDRRLVFDLNDFDETLPGPWEWDAKRLAASFAVAGRDIGLGRDARRTAVVGAVESYRSAMREFAQMRTLDVWYARLDIDEQYARFARQVGGTARKRIDKVVTRARAKDSLRAFAKLAYDTGGEPRIRADPPLVVPLGELFPADEQQAARDQIARYVRAYTRTLEPHLRRLLAQYRIVDIAHKVVGVGSVGTRSWIVLLIGRDASDPLFLQLKEAERSVLAPFVAPARVTNEGRRVVTGQRLMQATGDVLLGWLRTTEERDGRRRDYYVRQLWDAKGSVHIDELNADELATYARLCGWTLARAHARTADRTAIAAYLGRGATFADALSAFAESYADQNERDYAAFARALATGR